MEAGGIMTGSLRGMVWEGGRMGGLTRWERSTVAVGLLGFRAAGRALCERSIGCSSVPTGRAGECGELFRLKSSG